MLNNYKEERDKAIEFNKKLRASNQKTIYPSSLYLTFCEEAMYELKESMNFLKEIVEIPSLIFTEAKNRWGSTQSFIYHTIAYEGKKNQKGTIHEFQAFLAATMNEVFQQWKNEQGIEEEMQIEVKNTNTFPSNFGIYVNGSEMIQFNIFEQKYGSRIKTETEDEIYQRGRNEEYRLNEELDEAKKQLALYKKATKDWSIRFTLSGLYRLIFRYRKTKEALYQKIKMQEEKIKLIEERIKHNRQQLPFVLEENMNRKTFFTLLEPFFLQFHYELETNTQNLY